MASDVQVAPNWSRSPVRLLMWGLAGFLLALPAVAMLFTAEVRWGPADFAAMGALLAAACGMVELGARISGNRAYRTGVGLAVAAGFLLVWINLAVGVIGYPENPANLMFLGVLAAAGGGAALARGRPAGMARAMATAGMLHMAVHAVAYLGRLGAEEPYNAGAPLLFLGLGFAALWLASATMFRIAAKAA